MKDLITLTTLQLFLAGFHAGSRIQFRQISAAYFMVCVWKNNAIFDLYKVVQSLRVALTLVARVVVSRSKLLFVNAGFNRDLIRLPEGVAGEPFSGERWIGGALTNFKKIWKHFFKFRFSEKKWNHFSRLNFYLLMRRLPGAVFVSGFSKGLIALNEAYKLYIPTVSLVDTNSFSDRILYPVYTNDHSWFVNYYFFRLLNEQAMLSKVRLIVRFGRAKGIFLQRKINRVFRKSWLKWNVEKK